MQFTHKTHEQASEELVNQVACNQTSSSHGRPLTLQCTGVNYCTNNYFHFPISSDAEFGVRLKVQITSSWEEEQDSVCSSRHLLASCCVPWGAKKQFGTACICASLQWERCNWDVFTLRTRLSSRAMHFPWTHGWPRNRWKVCICASVHLIQIYFSLRLKKYTFKNKL